MSDIYTMRANCVRRWLEYHIRKNKINRKKLIKLMYAFFLGFIDRKRLIEIYNEVEQRYPTLDTFFIKKNKK